MLIVQQQFNKVQVLYSDNLVVFSLKQPLVAHNGKCLVTQMVKKLGTLAHDKESPNNETSRRLSKVQWTSMGNKQKHRQLSLDYSV